MRGKRARFASLTLVFGVIAMLGITSLASAKLTGVFTRFEFCPRKAPEVTRCVYSLTDGGEVVLGSKKVPIVNPVTLQGGYTRPNFDEESPEFLFSKFVAATNGVTLSKAPQPVPGGLLGLLPPESSPPLIKALVKAATENGLTGVNSTLELARPASEIRLSENHLAEGEGVALVLPLKARLENPVLGSSCYVGSSANPIYWELTTGKTNPPPPNEPINGFVGNINFLEGATIIEAENAVLVDNAWSAPEADGCGGLLSAVMDPIINTAAGLPAATGNSAVLKNTVMVAARFRVNENDEANP